MNETRRNRPGRFHPFDARDYGGGSLRGWWDASRQFLTDGDAISTATDASGQGNHATQSGGNRPVFKVGIQNGLPGMLFARASSQYLLANGIATAISGTDLPVTALMVIRPVTLSTGVTHVFAGWGTSVAANPRFWFYSNSAQYNALRRDDAALQVTGAVAGETTSPQVLAYRFTGTQVQLYRDGAALAAASGLDVGAITMDRFAIGANLQAGVAANFYDGYVHEMAVYAADLTPPDLAGSQQALREKWGIFAP